MRLVLIRHGETEHNRGQLTLGRADVPLNARGLLQAAAIGAYFTRRPDAVYTSPLVRARETAAAIARRTGVEPVVDEGVIEMDVGEMEHLTGPELRQTYPEFLRLWMSAECADARMPGGETLREVRDRAWASVGRLRDAHPEGTVVAVTHNFVILMLLTRCLAMPIGEFRRLRVAVGSRSILDITDDRIAVLQFNDVSHLLAAGLADDLAGREARA
jgi:probable phosphoglycerate mutase